MEPKYLSRVVLFQGDGTTPNVTDGELEAVTNSTLCNALRQLASLALVADDIFRELAAQLNAVHVRCKDVKVRIDLVENRVAKIDPKKVPVRKYMLMLLLVIKKIKNWLKQYSPEKIRPKPLIVKTVWVYLHRT